MRKEYKQMMDQLSPREELVEQVLAQAGAHAEQKQNRRRPMHKKKLILALAAALVVLTGSAMAVGSQLGLHPVVTLSSMFVGAQLFGVVGLFGFPILLSLLKNLNDTGTIRLFR